MAIETRSKSNELKRSQWKSIRLTKRNYHTLTQWARLNGVSMNRFFEFFIVKLLADNTYDDRLLDDAIEYSKLEKYRL